MLRVPIGLKTVSQFVILIVLSFQTAYADVNVYDERSILNGQTTPQTLLETSKSQVIERQNESEIIDPQTGSLTIKQNDLSLPGRDGLDFNLTRIYQSNEAQLGKMRMDFSDSATATPYFTYQWYFIFRGYYVYDHPARYEKSGYYKTNAEAVAACHAIEENSSYIMTKCHYEETDGTYYSDDHYSYTKPLKLNYAQLLNVVDPTSYNRMRYDLGAGWSFGFPSVEIIKTQLADQGFRTDAYFHDGQGASYLVDFTPDETDSNLKGYEGKDIKFESDNSGYSNGQVNSKYVIVTSDQKKTYFAEDGRILGVKDRFGNEIKFTHINRSVNGISYPYLDEITDTIGRKIKFTYANQLDTQSEDYITVDVSHPDTSKKISVRYTKTRDNIDGRFEPKLFGVTLGFGTTDATTNYFLYENKTQRFRYDTKDLTNAAIVYNQLLRKIVYPHSVTNFHYNSFAEDLGSSGSFDAFKVSNRYDELRYASDNPWNLPSNNSANLAQNKQTTASYVDGSYSSSAVDANPSTGWIGYEGSWMTVDLGSIQPINEMDFVLLWNWQKDSTGEINEYATNYTFSFSEDGNMWYPMLYENNGFGNADVISDSDLNIQARYFKIDIRKTYNQQAVRLCELQVFHKPSSGLNHNRYYYMKDRQSYSSTSYYRTLQVGADDLLTISTFNNQNQLYRVETKSKDGEKKVTNYLTYHPTFTHKPSRIETIDYSPDGSSSPLYVDYTYTDWGGLESETLPLQKSEIDVVSTKSLYTTKYEYDPIYRFITKKTRHQNDSTLLTDTWEYEASGRLKRYTNSNNEQTEYSYELANNYVSKVTTMKLLEDGKKAITDVEYGQVYKYAWPTRTTSYYTNNQGQYVNTQQTIEYDILRGQKTITTENNKYETSYTYDDLGRLKSTTLPIYTSVDGKKYQSVQRNEYANQVTSSIFYGANINLLTFKVRTYLEVTSLDQSQIASYGYQEKYVNGMGNLVYQQSWDPERNQWIADVQYLYDKYSRPTSYQDAEQNSWSIHYDSWGRQAKFYDPYDNVYITDYDLIQRKQTSFMLRNSDQYSSGNLSLWKNVSVSSFDKWGRLTNKTSYPSWPDQNDKVSETLSYDTVGNIIQVRDPKGYNTSYVYDKLNRLYQVTNPLNQTTTYTYTALGQLKDLTQVDEGRTFITSKRYDELGRLVRKINPDLQAEIQEYNTFGEVEKAWDLNQVQFNYLYDETHRLIQSTAGSTTFKTYYGNNPFGPVRKEQLNGQAVLRSTNYTYDYAGRIKDYEVINDQESLKVSNSYDKIGRLSNQTNGYNFSTAYGYDKSRIKTVQADSKTVTYEFNDNGTIKGVAYPENNGSGVYVYVEYQYDGMNRVKKVTNCKKILNAIWKKLSSFEYEYDANSNIKSVTDSRSGTTTYEYDELNRLSIIHNPDGSNTSYSYDERGNRKTLIGNQAIDFQDTNYSYNEWNELTKVDRNGNAIELQYAPETEGLRIKKNSSTGTVRYTYDSLGRIIAESDASNNVLAQYVWGPDRLLFKKDKSGNVYYYVYNAHGDVVQLVDEDGNLVNDYRYDEWGNLVYESEGVQNIFKYAGEVYDKETGLYYLKSRYYDPSVGRFINKDTYEGDISNPLSLNLYTYVENNPLGYTDPTGHFKDSDNLELRDLVENYERSYNLNKIIGNKKEMEYAEKAADAIRVAYYNYLGADYFPSDIKYTDGVFPTRPDIRYSNAIIEFISFAVEGTGFPSLSPNYDEMDGPKNLGNTAAAIATASGMILGSLGGGEEAAASKGLTLLKNTLKAGEKVSENTIKTTLEDGSLVIFKNMHQHPIRPDFPDSVQHYGIEIYTPDGYGGYSSLKNGNFHFVVDSTGKVISTIIK